MTEEKMVIGDQLINTVRPYCLIEDRWFTPDESASLRDAMADVWSGYFVKAALTVLGAKGRPTRIGPHLQVYGLPLPGALEQHPAVARDIAEKYGFMIAFEGEGIIGLELYFVERGALSLSKAIAKFEPLSLLKLN